MAWAFREGDILLVRSSGWVGSAIRRLTRNRREGETRVNHAGIFSAPNEVVEALTTGVRSAHVLDVFAGYADDEVAVYRARDLSDHQRRVMASYAKSYVGRPYGYLKIATHALDWCLGGAYIFRRLTQADSLPICSWVVARCYGLLGLDFGVPAGAASPDDVWDFCTSRPDKYECILPLSQPCPRASP